MKQLTLNDIRKAIYELGETEINDDISRMDDETFAKCNFKEEFGLDSLGVMEVTINLERNCDVNIPSSASEYAIFHNTIQAMLDRYNQSLN
ncbi:MAG: hypothetical protein IJ218_00950 [Alphaproteobacteria bacterium]|nr:hypothetical protein [Alphaproteobacteria bacterium]